MQRTIFVLSSGRTGTTFLSHFFKANVPNCVSVHEPRRLIKLHSNAFLAHRVGEARMRSFLRSHAAWVERRMAATNAAVYVQSDPWLYGFLPWLEKTFNGPYVIHVVRHPEAYVQSRMNRWYREKVTGFLRNAIPYWRLRGDLTGAMTAGQWRAMAEEEQVAWHWATVNGRIEEYSVGFRNYLRVRFEDLFADDGEQLSGLLSFCGLDSDGRVHTRDLERNQAPARFPASADWPPAVRQAILDRCAPLMEKYGYEPFDLP